MLRADHGVRVERVAVAIQAGNHIDRLGQCAVMQDRVVDPELHQAPPSTSAERDGASPWEAMSMWDTTSTDAPPLAADSTTAASTSMLCTPSSKDAQRGRESASSMPATSSKNARAW